MLSGTKPGISCAQLYSENAVKGSPLPSRETERISCGVKTCIVSLLKKAFWNESVWVIQPTLSERDGPVMTPVKKYVTRRGRHGPNVGYYNGAFGDSVSLIYVIFRSTASDACGTIAFQMLYVAVAIDTY